MALQIALLLRRSSLLASISSLAQPSKIVLSRAAACLSVTPARLASSAPAPAGPPTLSLSSIRDNAGARKRTRRKGRGVGSGHGLARSAGEGSKGTKSHEGGSVSAGFEGGQAPLWRRTPKIGVAMPRMLRRELATLNLDRLQAWVDAGRVPGVAPGVAPGAAGAAPEPLAPLPLAQLPLVTMKTLRDCGLVGKVKFGVKLLARGKERFAARLRLEVTQASAEAIRAVEAAGGAVTSVYYTPLALRSLLRPEKFEFPIKSPRPPPNKIGYFLNYRNRGYLSSRLQLERLKAGADPASLVPVYVGGGPVENATDDLHLTGLEPAGKTAAPPS
jgi:large subunit ribosomal protein L15